MKAGIATIKAECNDKQISDLLRDGSLLEDVHLYTYNIYRVCPACLLLSMSR